MGALRIVRLDSVLAHSVTLPYVVTLPYGRFVNGIYRAATLVKYGSELKAKNQIPKPRTYLLVRRS